MGENCHLPEINMFVKKGSIVGKCAACGWAGDLDNNHKLAAFIIKNPPDASGININDGGEGKSGGKASKQERREAKLRKKEQEEGKDDDDDDASGSGGVKEKKEKKE